MDKVNIYARVDAEAWRQVQAMSDDPQDPVHFGRSASQIVDLALREYVERRAEKAKGKAK